MTPSMSRQLARRQVALIRGINVGKAKRVPMAGLREALGELGFENVRTLLNSGNVVFDAAGSPRRNAALVEDAIAAHFDVSARVLGLAARELATVVAENPLGELAGDPSRLMVVFWLDPQVADAVAPLVTRDWGPERLAVGSHAAYVWCPEGILASAAHEAVSAAAGSRATVRNWRTVLK